MLGELSEVTVLGMSGTDLLGRVLYLAVVVAIAAVVERLVARVSRRLLDASSVPSASIFVNILRGMVWVFALVTVLKPVFGIDPTSLVAALGITSVVISFGLQDTVSNIFSGLGLMVGRVVAPGDCVEVSGFRGMVRDVNWRHTTVEDRFGNVQIIPNSVLNKTSFKRFSDAQRGSCGLAFDVAPGWDLSEVAREASAAVREETAPLLRPGTEPSVSYASIDAWGAHGTVWLNVRDDVTFSSALDAAARALGGREWLACAVRPLAEPRRDVAEGVRG